MKIVFLGTGTSVGVPMIGCACPVCTSADPRNRRSRASLYLTSGATHLVVDTPPDFRAQALAHRYPRIDAVLFTHAHADHIFGFDDIRRFNTMQGRAIPAWAGEETLADLRRVFNYVGGEVTRGGYRPHVEFRPTGNEPFAVGDVAVRPVRVEHGGRETLGFRFDAGGRSCGYVPDCHTMDAAGIAAFAGVDVMVLDALRHRPHATHMTLEESLRLLEAIRPGRAFLIHMCHDLDHAATEAHLPGGVRLAYDGLAVDW